MTRTLWTVAAATVTAAVLGLIGCATTQRSPELMEEIPVQTGPPPAEWTQPPPSSPPAVRGKVSTIDVQQVVRGVSANATAAAVVLDLDSDTETISENADRQFYAGSLVKLLVGLDTLLRAPGDELKSQQVATMLVFSDDTICSELWVAGGGGRAIIGRMSQLLQLDGTQPPRTRPGQWGDTLITAHDLVLIYKYILTKAPEEIRETMIRAMANAAEHGSDHFFQYFGIPSAFRKTSWAIKQAWTNNAAAVSAHSTGLIGAGEGGAWRYLMILLTEHPPRQTIDVAADSVSEAAVAIAPLIQQ
ncbi:hypothetical protein LWC34_27620 [Kibdelosporangium philippinense]|uniref:Serine hydrolase n=1 Tax=Kibdelosporangium philippinense TaxID=211113 RepID=A0ABS8ZFH4_9PSEU|nr:hypothetical protein [Kibdelosporangium philippinense]MCE7006571.1 hypothetical protein [Kibdelosporangium philippinense]